MRWLHKSFHGSSFLASGSVLLLSTVCWSAWMHIEVGLTVVNTWGDYRPPTREWSCWAFMTWRQGGRKCEVKNKGTPFICNALELYSTVSVKFLDHQHSDLRLFRVFDRTSLSATSTALVHTDTFRAPNPSDVPFRKGLKTTNTKARMCSRYWVTLWLQWSHLMRVTAAEGSCGLWVRPFQPWLTHNWFSWICCAVQHITLAGHEEAVHNIASIKLSSFSLPSASRSCVTVYSG